ncbi:MAG: C1 family peptidase [Planctomycetota bacterium]
MPDRAHFLPVGRLSLLVALIFLCARVSGQDGEIYPGDPIPMGKLPANAFQIGHRPLPKDAVVTTEVGYHNVQNLDVTLNGQLVQQAEQITNGSTIDVATVTDTADGKVSTISLNYTKAHVEQITNGEKQESDDGIVGMTFNVSADAVKDRNGNAVNQAVNNLGRQRYAHVTKGDLLVGALGDICYVNQPVKVSPAVALAAFQSMIGEGDTKIEECIVKPLGTRMYSPGVRAAVFEVVSLKSTSDADGTKMTMALKGRVEIDLRRGLRLSVELSGTSTVHLEMQNPNGQVVVKGSGTTELHWRTKLAGGGLETQEPKAPTNPEPTPNPDPTPNPNPDPTPNPNPNPEPTPDPGPTAHPDPTPNPVPSGVGQEYKQPSAEVKAARKRFIGEPVEVPRGMALPDRYSLRPWMPRIEDQQTRGTCVAFTLNGVLQYLTQRDLSEQYTYYVCETDEGGNEYGLVGMDAALCMCEHGTVEEPIWPYVDKLADGALIAGGPPPATIKADTKMYRFSQVRRLAKADIDHFRYAIAVLHRPVVVSVPVDWDAGWRDGDITIPKNAITPEPGNAEIDLENQRHGAWHAVSVIGYQHWASRPNESKFILRNSWGENTAWGGYYTIPFEYIAKYIRYAFIVDCENPAVKVDDEIAKADNYQYTEFEKFKVGEGRYEFAHDLVVGPKQTLDIPRGATLHFQKGAGLQCYGKLECRGGETTPILISGDPGWTGVECSSRRGRATMTWTTIDGGTKDWGGCLKVAGGAEVSAENCVFRNGRGTEQGGLVAMYGMRDKELHTFFASTLTARKCRFENGQAPEAGGIRANPGSTLRLDDCVISGCKATGEEGTGGAMLVLGSDDRITEATLQRCEISGCSATDNSGAFNANIFVALKLSACAFTNNSAGKSCGVFSVYSRADKPTTVTLDNCTFTGNSTAGSSGVGFIGPDARVTGRSATFTNNKAGSTGGCFGVRGAGGEQPELKLSDCTFTGNSGDSGGAINAYGNGHVVLERCKFTQCTAGAEGNGGAIHVYRGKIVATQCTFDGNSARLGGAAACVGGGTMDLATCTFSANKSSKLGGAFYSNGSADAPANLKMRNCTFTKNHAADAAGGIMFNGGVIAALESCKFPDNTSGEENRNGLYAFAPADNRSEVTCKYCQFKDDKACWANDDGVKLTK